MANVFWQIDNPAATTVGRSHIVNFGWHLLEDHAVHRRPMERGDGLLIATVRGTPRLRHGREWARGRRGSVSLYLVGEEQDYGCDGPWEAYWFHLIPSPEALAILRAYGIEQGRTWPNALDEQELERHGELFACERLPRPLAFYRAAAMADRLLFRCLGDEPGERAKPRRSRLADVMDYVRLHPARAHSVAALARMAGLSPSRFAHVFRQEQGMAIGAYVQRCRMERAQHLLRTTTMTAAEIAAELGYQSPYAFSHAFKRATGKRPTSYRNQR
jgi:AraC family transcriptional regulator of arabinose operon